MRILIKEIPLKDHRYPTLGDYTVTEDGLIVLSIAAGFSEGAKMCLILHELVEMFECQREGITFQQIDHFDQEFEKRTDTDPTAEPGDDPDAPYRKQHRDAENIERLFAQNIGLHWDDYVEEFDRMAAELDKLVAAGHWPNIVDRRESALNQGQYKRLDDPQEFGRIEPPLF